MDSAMVIWYKAWTVPYCALSLLAWHLLFLELLQALIGEWGRRPEDPFVISLKLDRLLLIRPVEKSFYHTINTKTINYYRPIGPTNIIT